MTGSAGSRRGTKRSTGRARSGRGVLVIANRLPVQRERRRGGEWTRSPGGLVSALTPLLDAGQGSWVGWSGQPGPAPAPFTLGGARIVPVRLTPGEVDRFYNRFSNQVLWPLYHDGLRAADFRHRWWAQYVKVNRRFSSVAARSLSGGAAAWVHDYHLQLVPALLRAAKPNARIGFFLHIPFPPEELFRRLPWRREIVDGLLGSDLVGFQTQRAADNFIDAAERVAGARSVRGKLRSEGRSIAVRAMPIAPDVSLHASNARRPEVMARAAQLRRKLGTERTVLLAVDRLDYTKGIENRLEAYGRLLASRRVGTDTCVLVQVAVPSREAVLDYADTRRRVEELVGRINGEHAEPGRVAVHYLRRNLAPEELDAFYLAADVMVVTPLRDGMNLVCKEFVACRHDGGGVLVLSEFAGAAEELREAMLVNPHDVAGMADALALAVESHRKGTFRLRMRALRRRVLAQSSGDWAAEFMAELRR